MDCHTEDTKNEGRQILSLRVAPPKPDFPPLNLISPPLNLIFPNLIFSNLIFPSLIFPARLGEQASTRLGTRWGGPSLCITVL